MIEKIHDDVFRIHIPLPNSPLKLLNAYCVKGDKRNLLIDTGFNRPECRDALLGGLNELEVRTESLDILVTHRHADHSGLAPDLMTHPETRAFADPEEADALNKFTRGESYWGQGLRERMAHGFSEEEVEALKTGHPGIRYVGSREIDFIPVQDGAELVYGRRKLRVIRTPGHTPGHLTLYEPSLKLYFSGDHILGDITPNITNWTGVNDSLGDYLKSLEAVRSLDVALVLPGHRSLFPDMEKRIQELKKHHAVRLDEVRRILKQESATGYAVASRMTWSLRNIVWKDFPIGQKFFATGEALSHLDRLLAVGEAVREKKDGLVYYSLTQPDT